MSCATSTEPVTCDELVAAADPSSKRDPGAAELAARELVVLARAQHDDELAIEAGVWLCIHLLQQGKLRDEVSTLRNRLEELQDALKKAPGNGMIKEEMDKVQAELASKSAKAETMSPKKECYRVCVHPHGAAAGAGSDAASPAGRRLLATTEAKDVNNCIRMCVKVMRMLVYRMAKKFL